LGREAGARLGAGLYHELRYETLVADPPTELDRVCRFLEIPFDDAMLRFHEGRQRSEPGLSAKEAWLPPTPGLRDWRTEMAPEDVERFEAAAGDLLDELGYQRTAGPSDEALRRVAVLRQTFADGMRSRRHPVPVAWAGASA
jgi:hypothetical protein